MKRALALLFILAIAGTARAASPVADDGLGNVRKPISCSPAVQERFDRALAMLYSFWYERALATFDDIIKADPQCRIAYWGAAMTFNHPLWAPPTATDLRGGIAYLQRGEKATGYNAEEAAYFAAAQALLADALPAHKQQRDEAYLAQMEHVYKQFPDDDSALFYALAIEGMYRYGATPERIEKAGSLAEGVRSRQPMHPGALHYIIHAYDQNGYEARALTAARAYAASAPAIPHALHMPSHTFIALGLWNESNASNEHAQAVQEHPEGAWHHRWFLEYGYLQTGRMREAKAIALDALRAFNDAAAHYHEIDADTAQSRYDMEETLGIVIDYALETGDYSLTPAATGDGLRPAFLAARMQYQALQAMKQRSAERARMFAAALDAFAATGGGPRVALISAETDGLLLIAQKRRSEGLARLAQAAAMERKANAVFQPLASLPANETYARELAAAGQRAKAREALNVALELTPNRRAAVALKSAL